MGCCTDSMCPGHTTRYRLYADDITETGSQDGDQLTVLNLIFDSRKCSFFKSNGVSIST